NSTVHSPTTRQRMALARTATIPKVIWLLHSIRSNTVTPAVYPSTVASVQRSLVTREPLWSRLSMPAKPAIMAPSMYPRLLTTRLPRTMRMSSRLLGRGLIA
ncbi:hypothetical protein LPJ56_002087, partial [Coemansia sp. RSA 2599]